MSIDIRIIYNPRPWLKHITRQRNQWQHVYIYAWSPMYQYVYIDKVTIMLCINNLCMNGFLNGIVLDTSCYRYLDWGRANELSCRNPLLQHLNSILSVIWNSTFPIWYPAPFVLYEIHHQRRYNICWLNRRSFVYIGRISLDSPYVWDSDPSL